MLKWLLSLLVPGKTQEQLSLEETARGMLLDSRLSKRSFERWATEYEGLYAARSLKTDAGSFERLELFYLRPEFFMVRLGDREIHRGNDFEVAANVYDDLADKQRSPAASPGHSTF